jgi:protein TonB
MEQRLFEDLIESDKVAHRTQHARTWPVSVALHSVFAVAIIVVPLLQAGLLPEPAAVKAFFVEPMAAPPPPPPPPPPAPKARRPAPKMVAPDLMDDTAFVAPTVEELLPEEGLDLGDEGGVEGGVAGGVPGGVIGGIVGGLPDAPLPPPQKAIRVGGQIKQPKKLKDVQPVYPDIAKQARVQGVVILECTISPQGRVTDVKVLRGIPLLNESALSAVRQWVYTPTLLNGVPVPVIMTVTVNFKLS